MTPFADPFAAPLQVTCEVIVIESVPAALSLMVTLEVKVHPFASVMVKEYVPAATPDCVSVIEPAFQL
jgi:hypothetical protein